MHDGLARQLEATPGIATPDELRVLLVLDDPADQQFMDVALGASGNGSVGGHLWICVWPSEENLARLEAVAVHDVNHNLRYCTVPWDPATVTVGERIVSEGLADAFARQLYGDLGYTRIGLPSLHDDAVFDKVVANLDVTRMQNFTAWVHGDAVAARYGATPVGVPTGAGYAVGNWLVDAYLAATVSDTGTWFVAGVQRLGVRGGELRTNHTFAGRLSARTGLWRRLCWIPEFTCLCNDADAVQGGHTPRHVALRPRQGAPQAGRWLSCVPRTCLRPRT